MVDALILDAQTIQQVIGAYLFFQSARRIRRSALLQFHNSTPFTPPIIAGLIQNGKRDSRRQTEGRVCPAPTNAVDFARKLADLGVLCQFLALPSCNPYKNSIV